MNRSSLCQAACENDQVSVNDITIKSKVDSYIIDGTDLNCLNTTGVTNMKEIFKDSIDFDGNLSCWDTSSVTNMEKLFYKAELFNGDINTWNVTSVTSMEEIFYGAKMFNGNISNWDVASVTEMSNMFYEAEIFNSPISSWDVTSVLNMGSMFRSATLFNRDISSWNVSSVTNIDSIFYSARAFNGTISDWDVALVRDMSSAFRSAVVFNGDISQWDVSSVTTMFYMFYEAIKFDIDLSKWNVTSVSKMDFMFYAVEHFTYPLLCWEAPNASKESMFDGSGCDPGCLLCASEIPTAILSNKPTLNPTKSSFPSLHPSNYPSAIPSNAPTVDPTDYAVDFYLPGYKECAKKLTCDQIKGWFYTEEKKSKSCKICLKMGAYVKCPRTCIKCVTTNSTYVPTVSLIPTMSSIPTTSNVPTTSADFKGEFRLPLNNKECSVVLTCKLIKSWRKNQGDKCFEYCFEFGGNTKCPIACKKCPIPSAAPSNQHSSIPSISNFPSDTNVPTASLVPTDKPTVTAIDSEEVFYLPGYKECRKKLSCAQFISWIYFDGLQKTCGLCSIGGDVECPVTCKASCPGIPTTSPIRANETLTPTNVLTIDPTSKPDLRDSDLEGEFRLPAYDSCKAALTCKEIKALIKEGTARGCIICLDQGGIQMCPETCRICPKISQNPSSTPSVIPSVMRSAIPSLSNVPSYVPTSLASVMPSVIQSTMPSTPPSTIPSMTPSSFPSKVTSMKPSSLPTFVPSISTFPSFSPSVSVLPSDAPTVEITNFGKDFYLPKYRKCTKMLSCNIIKKWIKDGNEKGCDVCHNSGGNMKCPLSCKMCLPTEVAVRRNLRKKLKDLDGRFTLKKTGDKTYHCNDFKEGIAGDESIWCKLCSKHGAKEVCAKSCDSCLMDLEGKFYLPDYKKCTKRLSCKKIKKMIKKGYNTGCNICSKRGGDVKCPEACSKCN